MPRPGTPFVHPRLETDLENVGWYESLCTIISLSTQKDALGQEEETPTPLVDHVDLPCRISPIVGVLAGQEQEGSQTTTVMRGMITKLPGAFPEISEKHKAVVDGTTYDIEKVDINSAETFTLLTLQVIE